MILDNLLYRTRVVEPAIGGGHPVALPKWNAGTESLEDGGGAGRHGEGESDEASFDKHGEGVNEGVVMVVVVRCVGMSGMSGR